MNRYLAYNTNFDNPEPDTDDTGEDDGGKGSDPDTKQT